MFLLFFFFLPFFPVIQCLPSCLHLRSHCLRNPVCASYFLSFEKTCGYSLTRCSIPSPSDCVRDLRKIREHLTYNSCICYRATGFTEECDFFRQLIWNHPCERLIEDAGQERRLAERHFVTPLPSPENKRSTRTPQVDRVHQLVQQLNGELHTKMKLESATCNEALNQVCMRHVSCRQLWHLFRSSCGVDQDNKCTMTDPQVCWQSFEGLSWTGLGNCHCDSTNSDCHWIRLLTNYNKCIYEISLTKTSSFQHDRTAEDYRRRFESSYSGEKQSNLNQQRNEPLRYHHEQSNAARYHHEQSQAPVDSSSHQGGHSYQSGRQDPRYESPAYYQDGSSQSQHRIWQERSEYQGEPRREEQRNRVWHVQYETTSTSTSTTMTTITTTTTPRPRIAVTRRPPVRTTSAPPTINSRFTGTGFRASVQEASDDWKEDSTYYRPLFNQPATTPPGYYHYHTTNAPERRYEVATTVKSYFRPTSLASPTTSSQYVYEGPTEPAATFLVTLSPFTRSTCLEAVSKCEAADECRWHLGELRARCSRTNCRRDDCASALQRFTRYVPASHTESVMFCQCSSGDSNCSSVQELFYPSCLYTSASVLPTCSQTAQKCGSDLRCRALRDQLQTSCPLSNGECVGRSLSDCRRVLLAARGSILEQPCFCSLNDVSCMGEQRMMIPSHPCIEKVMRDLPLSASTAPISTVIVPRDNYHREKNRDDTYTKEILKESAATGISNYQDKKDVRSRQRHKTTSTTTTEMPSFPTTTFISKITSTLSSPTKTSGRLKHKTTVEPPPATEAPPPWETTTVETVTTTEEYITAPPPPAEGCEARDANGRNVFFPMGTIMRRYVDWSSRCSSWCECTGIDQLACERLPCLDDGVCEAPLTTIEFGERIFLKNRGACFCETGSFICELPEEMPELYPGLYITAGYSEGDVEMLRKEVPSATMEKAGLMSAEPAKDIGSRLQMAFERLKPESLQCRLVLMSELSEPGHAFFRVEWFGLDERFNHTKAQWQHDGSEKVCSPPVTRLADLFSNSDSLRYQLILSTVKQLKVLDYLDGLPPSSSLAMSCLLVLFLPLLMV